MNIKMIKQKVVGRSVAKVGDIIDVSDNDAAILLSSNSAEKHTVKKSKQQRKVKNV